MGSWKEKMGKMGFRQWGIVLLLGLLVVVAVWPTARGGTTDVWLGQEETAVEGMAGAGKSELEQKLENLLASAEGVGQVQVLLMTEQEQGSFSSSGAEHVTGVLITAQGADNSVTIQKIQEAVMALFQVEAHKIKVMKMK